MCFANMTGVDQTTPGITYRMLVRHDQIQSVVDLSNYAGRAPGSSCMVKLQGVDDPFFVSDSFEDVEKELTHAV